MRKQSIFIIALFFIISIFIKAQSGDDKPVIIHQDPAVEKLVNKHIAINKHFAKSDGYRVQIFSIGGVNSRDRANLMKAEFLAKYPETEVYIVYNAPSYKVRLGDFRRKLDAERFLTTIKADYPFAFVVIDKIEFK